MRTKTLSSLFAARYSLFASTRYSLLASLLGASLAVAAPLIPSTDLPGREQQRFVDPPAARLMWPQGPAASWPNAARPLHPGCRTQPHTKRRHANRQGC